MKPTQQEDKPGPFSVSFMVTKLSGSLNKPGVSLIECHGAGLAFWDLMDPVHPQWTAMELSVNTLSLALRSDFGSLWQLDKLAH